MRPSSSLSLHMRHALYPCTLLLAGGLLGAFAPSRSAFADLAFSTDRDGGDREIYVMDDDGSAATNLTRCPLGHDTLPVWSPDLPGGRKLAFASGRDGNAEVYVMNVAGSLNADQCAAQTNLTENPTAFDSEPAWSPDGTKLAFERQREPDGPREIYVMNADGSLPTPLTNNGAFNADPAWSPDGTKLAFASNRDGNFEIYTMNADQSGEPKRLTENGAFDGHPAWSPDGMKLAFESEREHDGKHDREIYVMSADGEVDGRAPTNLTNYEFFDGEPIWSPDGMKLAFARELSDGNFEVFVMNSDGSSPTNLTRNPSFDFEPDWTRRSSASTAIGVDEDHMIVGDDEDQFIRLYDRNRSGEPLNNLARQKFDFTTSLGLTDLGRGQPREVDIEASTRTGDIIFWLGSHSNGSSGSSRPNRNRLFRTDLSGGGTDAKLTIVGYYTKLRADLTDPNHPDAAELAVYDLKSAIDGKKPPEAADGSGFNIEGLARAPNSESYYLGFRQPIVQTKLKPKDDPTNDRRFALIVPVTNLESLVCDTPCDGIARFLEPIELDLGRRGIRSLECNKSGCLIVAGPPATTGGSFPKDFRLYTWSGNRFDRKVELRSADLTNLAPAFNPEGIVALPSGPLTRNTLIQLVSDDGDIRASTFRSAIVALGDVVTIANSQFLPPVVPKPSFDPTPVPLIATAGKLFITAIFTSKRDSTALVSPLFQVMELSGGNLLLNATGGSAGAGATLTPDVGSDGVLSPGEAFTVRFEIGLQTLQRFKFSVNLLGVQSRS